MDATGSRAIGLRAFAGLALAFIYVPIALVVLFSFNTSEIAVWPLEGFTSDWYGELARSERSRDAFLLFVQIALTASDVASVLRPLLAYAAHRVRCPGKRMMQRVIKMPLVVPGSVTGIGLATMFEQQGIALS